jgi:hypothetical protein
MRIPTLKLNLPLHMRGKFNMKIPIILLTVFFIVLAGCLTTSASYGPTQDNNHYAYYTGNGYSAYNNHGTYDLDVSSGYYYPNENNANHNVNSGSATESISNPSLNGVTTYTVCTDNNCHVGSDGSVVKITNYDNATDPSYDQLLTFLKADKNDEHPYIDGQYICVHFAKTLHDTAEKSGIKAAFIGCDFSDNSIGHAFNMFNTTDKGIVYIDDTGVPGGSTYEDKILNVAVGQSLTGQYLFKEESTGRSMGVVKKLYVYW